MKDANMFAVSSNYTEEKLVEVLESKFLLQKDQSKTEPTVLFDTFDWRLFKASLLLYQSGDELILVHQNNSNILLHQPVYSTPGFVWDLPDGKLKTYLEPVIEMRALLKLGEVDITRSSYRLLNKEKKTVVCFSYETLEAKDQKNEPDVAIARDLIIKPVRGYLKPARKLREMLYQMEGIEPKSDSFMIKAFELGKRKPADYLASLKVELAPQMRADEATKIILRSALRVIKINEDGIKKDIDIEFLHDFRVAMRRTRSVLSQVKGVFPEDVTLKFKRDFAAISKISNDLRDLDVYLYAEKNFKAMLPDTMQSDIDPLFDYMRKKRVTALKDVVDGLNSTYYTQTLTDWEAFLNEPAANSPTAFNAATPVKELAQKRIYNKYRYIIKRGRQILENTQDEQLHSLRIECKKLRYLLDFFQSLFSGEKIEILIKQVKKLQTNLGDFNDLSVQEEYALATTTQLPIQDSESRKVFVAVGRMIGAIQQKREQVKNSFAQIFTDFATIDNQELFRELFYTRKKKKQVK